MPDIVLATVNAKYIHSAFGLRYLLANLGPLRDRARLMEFDLHQRAVDIMVAVLEQNPRIVGLGVYVWNATVSAELVRLLKRVRPELFIVLGGPEVSYETLDQPICRAADYVVTGEADLVLPKLCEQILSGLAPVERIIAAEPPDLAQVVLPYELYTAADLEHRLTYLEASRGCPFHCHFCLSALDIPVRQVPLAALFSQLEGLLKRGARHFKFVDRTFNLRLETSRAVLEFLLARYRPGLFFHFEVVPDHLPERLREVIRRFPPGALQFEVGVQTFNPAVAERIERRQDPLQVEQNLRFLRQETGVHLHADLIVGLPGESLESFAAGFDRLVALHPQEIQVGLLKRLRGAPISTHEVPWGLVFNPHPPYEILCNKQIDFQTMQRLRRVARYWDLVSNSGNFVETAPMLWAGAATAPGSARPAGEGARENARFHSPFTAFLQFSDWLFSQMHRTDSIALLRLAELIYRYLTERGALDVRAVSGAMTRDYQRCGRREGLAFLTSPSSSRAVVPASANPRLARRQRRHAKLL